MLLPCFVESTGNEAYDGMKCQLTPTGIRWIQTAPVLKELETSGKLRGTGFLGWHKWSNRMFRLNEQRTWLTIYTKNIDSEGYEGEDKEKYIDLSDRSFWVQAASHGKYKNCIRIMTPNHEERREWLLNFDTQTIRDTWINALQEKPQLKKQEFGQEESNQAGNQAADSYDEKIEDSYKSSNVNVPARRTRPAPPAGASAGAPTTRPPCATGPGLPIQPADWVPMSQTKPNGPPPRAMRLAAAEQVLPETCELALTILHKEGLRNRTPNQLVQLMKSYIKDGKCRGKFRIKQAHKLIQAFRSEPKEAF